MTFLKLIFKIYLNCYCFLVLIFFLLFQSVDEHMQLSFSHIMKHWKRNPGAPGSGSGGTPGKTGPGSRNVLLRFYPPQSALGNFYLVF